MNSAEIIRTCRERAGMTRRQLADAIGVGRDLVWRWEEHGTCLKVDNLIAVIDATGFELIVKEKYRGGYGEEGRRYK